MQGCWSVRGSLNSLADTCDGRVHVLGRFFALNSLADTCIVSVAREPLDYELSQFLGGYLKPHCQDCSPPPSLLSIPWRILDEYDLRLIPADVRLSIPWRILGVDELAEHPRQVLLSQFLGGYLGLVRFLKPLNLSFSLNSLADTCRTTGAARR